MLSLKKSALASFLLFTSLARAQGANVAVDDLTLTGTLRGNQAQHTFVEVPFTVPAGIERVSLTFSFTGKEDNTKLDLGMEDPERLRGWSGGNKSAFTIGVSDATPSYLPGPIVPGTWKLVIRVANLRPAATTEYKAMIHLTKSGQAGVEGFADHPLNTEARWYRGDLHMHTAHSDGSCPSQSGKLVPCPLFVTAAAAAAHGLDFIAITDHNATSHYNDEREMQPYFDRMLLIPGREMTTTSGHTNFYGSTHFVDFRVESPGYPGVDAMFKAGHALGEIASINHPVRPGGEVCIGCRWEPEHVDMRLVDAIEAINSPDTPQDALLHTQDIAFWQQQLNAGYRITAIGGSDTHQAQRGTIGQPTTVVYAQELSVPSVLAGIKAGHVFIDLTASKDKVLEMSASAGTSTAKMGDALPAATGAPITIEAEVANCAGLQLQFVEDGKVAGPSQSINTGRQTLKMNLISDGRAHWIRANILSASGSLQLLGNPIYLNYQEK